MVVDAAIRLAFGLPVDVVSREQEGLRPLNRATEYGGVPPVQLIEAVRVADWPESMASGEIGAREAERAGFTMN